MRERELTISNIWSQIPIEDIVQEDCNKCLFAQIAILGGKDYGGIKLCYRRGIDFCLKLLKKKHKGANLAHLILILKNCGSPDDPAGCAEWKDYAGSMKKLEKAFESELPSLEGANLEYADLKYANLIGANLEGANLEYTDFRDADLRDADLEGANLRGANLEDANLRGADLEKAILIGANLEGADLIGAYLKYARYNSETKFPAGFDTEYEGMIKV